MSQRYQIVVIGGGIHGVAVAQAAAAHGYSVLLLERDRLAAGASSSSTKLIHGGLRYLEHGHIGLVRESLLERRLLLARAPELVRLLPMQVPVYADSSRTALKIRAGLSAYGLLGGLSKSCRFKQVDALPIARRDGLRQDGLCAMFRYQEAQTDDVALTRAVLQSALDLGAESACPAEFVAATISTDGSEVHWRQDNTDQVCNAAALVNATGAWIDSTAARMTPRPQLPGFRLVQGSHLLLDQAPAGEGYYLEAPQDRRPVFMLPWQGRGLLGTTEIPFQGDPGDVRASIDERDYLLQALTHYFPHHEVDVLDAFSGLRVLPEDQGSLNAHSRETRLVVDDPARPRVLTIMGGKLTTHRATAEKALRQLAGTLGPYQRSVDTRTLPLTPVED